MVDVMYDLKAIVGRHIEAEPDKTCALLAAGLRESVVR